MHSNRTLDLVALLSKTNSSASSCLTILQYSNAWIWTASLFQFVANCARAFTTDQDLLGARRELDKIIAAAIGRPVEELEADDEINNSFGIRKVKKKVEEKSPWYVIDHHSQED